MPNDSTPITDELGRHSLAPGFRVMQKHAKARMLTGKAIVIDLGNGLRAVGERTSPHVYDGPDIYEGE